MADHKHPIIDADPHFSIDITNRTITNSKSKKVSLIQYDHNSERFSFDIDREIEGHDIMDCNRIQIHYINTSASTRTKHIGLYEVTDKQVHPDNDKKVCFTWLISENATHYEGMLSFLVAFECVDGEEILYRWNSGICNAISIVAGINNNNAVTEVYVDELLKWENYIVEHFDELETELVGTTIPALVDERYVEREFATSEEVAAIFALDVGDIGNLTVTDVVQETGQSKTAVMSQKATTDALDGKVDKIDSGSYWRVYVVDVSGTTTYREFSFEALGNKLPIRDANGRLRANEAADNKDVVNLGQLKTVLVDYLSKPSEAATEDSVVVIDSEGNTTYKKVSELGSGGSSSPIASIEFVPIEESQ